MPGPRLSPSRALAPAVILCAVLAPVAVHWLSGRSLVWFDTQAVYAPQRWLVDEALRSLRLPLWNPFMGGGMPFLADAIHGVLHPVSILTAWLGTGRSADLLIGGHLACGGLGAALLARDLGASRPGAAAAAVVYGSSGYVLSMAGNLVFLAGAGSLPFCVAGLRRFAAEPGPAHLAFGAGATASLAFSGDAQAVAVGGVLALALAWEAGGWRGAARAVGAVAVGLMVAGVQLLPTAVHLPRTDRSAELWTASPRVWPLTPWRLAELVLPGLCWGQDPLRDPVFGALVGPEGWPAGGAPAPFTASVFVGVVPLVLASAGLRSGRRGALLGLLALLLLWGALGPALGADAVLGRLPIWRAFRYAEKLVGPLTLLLALLAGLGLDAASERRVTAWPLLATAALLAVASIGGYRLAASGLEPYLASEALARVERGTFHLLGAAAGLGGWLLLRERLGLAGGRAALAALAWAGMVAATPAALRPGAPAARVAAPGPSLEAPAPGPRIATPYRSTLIFTPGQNRCDLVGREQAALGYPAFNVAARLDSLTPYAAMHPRRLSLLTAMFEDQWPVAARRYGVTHVLANRPKSPAQWAAYEVATGEAVLLPSTGPDEVWAVPHRAWASFAPAVRLVGTEREALAATFQAVQSGSAAVVVESAEALPAGPGRVLGIERGLETVRIEAEAESEGTLVVADAWWPGWEATIDGADTPIYPADALVRAVRWPAGRHVLEMRYRPPEVRRGLLLSALGLAAAAAWGWRLRRGRPPAGSSRQAGLQPV